VCVCVFVCVCLCVGVWVCGCVGVWVCGCVYKFCFVIVCVCLCESLSIYITHATSRCYEQVALMQATH
jgi:hypothetical protein